MKRTNYVVGFLFSADMESVALIEKQKPEWQRGFLNGIGGKVEGGETPAAAMQREFGEEANYQFHAAPEWKHFCAMSGINNDGSSFGSDFFFAFGQPDLALSREVETIGVYNSGAVVAGDWRTVGNVPWLVALARDFGKGIHPPSLVQVWYVPSVAKEVA